MTETTTVIYSSRPLGALLLANAISWTGNSFAIVALPWFVLETTGSASLTGLAGAAAILPNFFAGLFGGVLVDRIGPMRISILGEILSGLAIAAIPLLHGLDLLSFPLLFLLIVIGAIFDIPGVAARRTLLVPFARQAGVTRERANAAFEASPAIALLLGPPVAGLVVATVGVSAALWIDAASFAISVSLLLWAMPVSAEVDRRQLGIEGWRPFLAEIREGVAYLWHEPAVRLITLGFLLVNLVGRPLFAVVLPIWVNEIGESATALGILLAAFGAGALAGSALYGVVGRRFPRRAWWYIYAVTLPVGFSALIPATSIWTVAVILALAGIADGAMVTMSVTVRQERIPMSMMGRVFSTSSAINVMAAPAGMVLAGWLLSHYSLDVAIGVMTVAAAIVAAAWIFNPDNSSLEAGPLDSEREHYT